MWEKFLTFIKRAVTLTGDQEKTRLEVKELRADLTRLTFIVQELSHKIDLLNQAREYDKEQVKLLIENQALKAEQKQIGPPAKKKPKSK